MNKTNKSLQSATYLISCTNKVLLIIITLFWVDKAQKKINIFSSGMFNCELYMYVLPSSYYYHEAYRYRFWKSSILKKAPPNYFSAAFIYCTYRHEILKGSCDSRILYYNVTTVGYTDKRFFQASFQNGTARWVLSPFLAEVVHFQWTGIMFQERRLISLVLLLHIV